MDDAVRRAMERWPDVPAVAGWLRLDRRGRWHVRNAATGVFERIEHPGIVAFIGRNYHRLDDGRWVFQNGPQRVYVTLERTPWIFRLGDAGTSLVSHTGATVGQVREARFDEDGALVIDTDLGPGLLEDRDLPALIERLCDVTTRAPVGDDVLETLGEGDATREVMFFGARVTLGTIRAADVPGRFGFVADPTRTAERLPPP